MVTLKDVPTSSFEVKLMSPPINSMIVFVIVKPSPVPWTRRAE